MNIKVFDYSEGTKSALVVAPEGEINTESTTDFGNALWDAVQTGNKMIVVDLANVEHINSGGVAVIASAFDRLGRAGCELCLCRPNRDVLSFLETIGITSFVRTVEDLEEVFPK